MFTTIMNRYQHEEPALKLYHLRRCLVDKAEGIIDQEIIDNNDYDAAWLLLKQQYEDKRIIVDKHVDNLNLLAVGLGEDGQEAAGRLGSSPEERRAVDVRRDDGVPAGAVPDLREVRHEARDGVC